MLNIGRLAPGAADYYLGEVATSAEDYYTGRGESQGRWLGTLAGRLGLQGTVDPKHFRAVLEGRHPFTGEHLVVSRGQRCRPARPVHPDQANLFEGDVLDVAQVAARLKVSTRHVRRFLEAGERASRTGTRVESGKALFGWRSNRGPRQPGLMAWSIPRFEVERLVSERNGVKARPGYDLTLRPPKSVSVLWALADRPRRDAIRDAHRKAVEAVVDYYEAHATYARRPTGERGRIITEGLIAAAFDHRTSRAGDPLLHTHVVTANMTLTAEGKWQAVDGRAIYEHARTAGFLYQAHLRHLLTKNLGLHFEPVRNGWAEIEGVPREVVRAFSKRRDEIEELIAESGFTSARSHQIATLVSRKAKEYGVDPLTLEERWRAEAEALGFGVEQVEACFGRATQVQEPGTDALFRRLAGPEGLTRQASTFTRADVVLALAEALGSSAPAGRIDALADAFLASPPVRALAPEPGQPGYGLWRHGKLRDQSPDLARYSTVGLLAVEERILTYARDGFGTPVPAATPVAVENVLARHGELSGEQAAMVRAVCLDAPAVQPVAGRPGAGKTYATAACAEALLDSGVPVAGCAVSAVAAAELEATTRLGEHTGRPASTIARLLIDAGRRDLPGGCVLIVDEASMVGTRDLARLLDHVARVGGAVKLVGDPDQHGPVETGGAFRRLVRDLGERVPRLVENNRQLDEVERAAVERFREGMVDAALAKYEAEGKVVRAPNAARCYEVMVDDWFEGVRAGIDDPMIAGTNGARRTLNAWARSRLKAEGYLSEPSLVAADREFSVGDWVVARRNATHLRSADSRTFVKNGSAGVVVGVDAETASLIVDFHAEGRILLPGAYLRAGHVEHAYARTTYLVQGATLQRALYHPSDTSSFEEGYVALTRGRHETRIYIVDGTIGLENETSHGGHERENRGLDTICEALERRRSRRLALDTDATAAASLDRFDGWTLAQLRIERERLDAILAGAPPAIDEELSEAVTRLDAMRARRQAWVEVTDQAGMSRNRRRPLGRRRKDADAVAVARQQIGFLDRTIRSAGERLTSLQEKARKRAAFLAEHNDEVELHRLVRRAELARELQIGAEVARTEPEDALSGGDDTPIDRQRWLAATQRAAVHVERYGVVEGDPEDPVESVLGRRPDEGRAAWSYDRAVEALRLAAEPELSLAEVSELDVLPAG